MLYSDLEQIFNSKIPRISLCAIGGFPIKIINDKPYLLNNLITEEFLKSELTKSLGFSGMLTYKNKSNFTLEQMGNKCKELKHLWGYNFITLSFLFYDLDNKVELSFLRNNTLYQSWIINDNSLYAFTGTIKDFIKFINNKNDKSFDLPTRKVMEFIYNNYNFLWM